MGPFTATNLLLTVSHCQFGLGLVVIVLLRLVIVGDDLSQLIHHQFIVLKKKMSLFIYMCMPNDSKIYKKGQIHE